ncbi:MAG: S1C family serine protease [Lachnospiraceae bacterium]
MRRTNGYHEKNRETKRLVGTVLLVAALGATTGVVTARLLSGGTTTQSSYWEAIPQSSDTSSAGSTATNTASSSSDSYSATNMTGSSADTTSSTQLSTTSEEAASSSTDVSGVVEAAMPSVVSITNTIRYQQYGYAQFGQGQDQTAEAAASGSGVIVKIDDDYVYIVTNHHVIADASELSVEFNDGTSADAQVVGDDSTDDIALIKVAVSDLSSDTLSQIKAITFADSDNVKIGSTAIAIGNALGYGQSVTTGIVSAKDRTITSESETMEGLLQTDAAINPGNSGGALLDANGNLIGINVAKYSSTDVEGMGYAIPSNKVLEIVEEMLEGSYSPSTSSASAASSASAQQGAAGQQGSL